MFLIPTDSRQTTQGTGRGPARRRFPRVAVAVAVAGAAIGLGLVVVRIPSVRNYLRYGLYKVDPFVWCQVAAGAAGLMFCLCFSGRLSARLRLPVRCLLLVLLLRLVWLYNPLAWEFYYRNLPVAVIGHRHSDQVKRTVECTRRQEPLPYLAVGSSQTYSIYGELARRREDLKTFALSGATALELLVYQDMIRRREPETVLLFLSEMDLARRPTFATLPSSPYQGLRTLKLWRMTAAACPEDVPHGEFFQLVAGDVVCEYKYSFLFKGMLETCAGRIRALPESSRTKVPPQGMLQQNLENLERNLDGRYIDLNCDYLGEFLRYLDEHGIRAVIIEGHYHPRAYSEKNLALHARAHERLLALARRFSGVEFVPRQEAPRLAETDFVDGYHVTQQAGLRFSSWVLQYLETRRQTVHALGANR